jgi:hypothetical protein
VLVNYTQSNTARYKHEATFVICSIFTKTSKIFYVDVKHIGQFNMTLLIDCFYFWVYPKRLVFKPLKMDPTEGSETSANINQTLGIHPKVETVNTEHSESLKSRMTLLVCAFKYEHSLWGVRE